MTVPDLVGVGIRDGPGSPINDPLTNAVQRSVRIVRSTRGHLAITGLITLSHIRHLGAPEWKQIAGRVSHRGVLSFLPVQSWSRHE